MYVYIYVYIYNQLYLVLFKSLLTTDIIFEYTYNIYNNFI